MELLFFLKRSSMMINEKDNNCIIIRLYFHSCQEQECFSIVQLAVCVPRHFTGCVRKMKPKVSGQPMSLSSFLAHPICIIFKYTVKPHIFTGAFHPFLPLWCFTWFFNQLKKNCNYEKNIQYLIESHWTMIFLKHVIVFNIVPGVVHITALHLYFLFHT